MVANAEDFFIDEIGADEGFEDTPIEEEGIAEEVDVDPFEEVVEEHGATVTLELPIEIVDELEKAIEVAEGEGQEGIEEEMGEGEIIEEGPVGEEIVEDEAVEEIGPDELDGIDEEISSKPALEPGAEDIDETKDITMFEEDIENKGGFSGENQKVKITVNGEPLLAETNSDTKEVFVMENNIGKIGKTQMDLSGVIDIVNKIASEKTIEHKNVQDVTEIGQYSAGENGSKMGHENETIPTAVKPSVPRANATMGQEPADLNPENKPQPEIPVGDAQMGHEEEAGYTGGDHTYTGGDKGQGETETTASVDADLFHMRGFGSSREGVSSLADRIAKKLQPKEPVAKDPDIQPIKGTDGGTIGKEEKFEAKEVINSEIESDSGFIGHEKETLKTKPTAPKDQPDINTGNAQMGEEKLDSEKTTKDKGTVIAKSDSESEAYRVAGRMLQTKKIEASDLHSKIEELKTYKPEQIKDIEKAIFNGEKGLNTVSDGKLSQTVQINETSSVRNNQAELGEKLSSLFSLDRQNKEADNNVTTQLRKIYNK